MFTVKICIFERSNEKNNFSKTKIYFHKKTTPQLLEHIGLQNMKVGDLISGDLPQYFKFVRWMLTSSLKIILKTIQYFTGSQCNDLSRGVI